MKSQCILGQTPSFDSEVKVNLDLGDVKFSVGKETNENRIENRLKQILFGKNTVGYDNYIAAVPKEKRKSPAAHPRTPDPYQDTSKRAFDGQIKAWRRTLHKWDNPDIRPDLIAYEEYKSRQNKMDCETTDDQQPQGSIVGQKRNQTEVLSGQQKKTKLNDSQAHKETKNSSNSGGNQTKEQEEIEEQAKKKNSLLIGEELEEVDYHSDNEEWNEYDEEDVL